MSGAPIIFDVSSLIASAARRTPNGVPRVELAYAKHLIRTVGDRLSFVATWGRFGQLMRKPTLALVETLDALWGGETADPKLRAQAADLGRKSRGSLLLRGHGWPNRTHAGGGRPHYLIVSHATLERPRSLRWFKERTGANVICLIHDLIPIEYPELVRTGVPRRHHRRMTSVAQLADTVIANSAATAAAFRGRFAATGHRPPVLVAPLGIDLQLPVPSPQSFHRPYFVCVATIEPRKNHVLLLRVWERLAARLGRETPRLLLIGRRGWHGWEIVRIIDRLAQHPVLAEFVEVHNRMPDRGVARVLAGARALLYPSLTEGYGLPVAEALALGVPVLCSDLPVLREVGRDVPEYLDSGDLSGWEEAILDYARKGSLRRQAQLSRLAAWRVPSWEEHFRRLQPLIGEAPPEVARRQYA
jgi:glycosyltransferase involved in cell wall biosynthesis